jgi:FkbM family methyltransferase
MCARGSTVIDVGSSEGLYALAMRAAVGSDGTVVAVEPNPASFAALRHRTWGAGIRSRHLALGEVSGPATLYVPGGSDGAPVRGLGSLVRPAGTVGEKHVVDATTLDDLVANERVRVGFVKIDVEGWELEVLRGATNVLARDRPRLLVEIEDRHLVRRPHSASEVVEWLLDQGYSAVGISFEGDVAWEDVRLDEHQRASDLADPRTRHKYVNNFLFTPHA